MRISPRGLNLIKHFEGCELKAYQDIVGVWTIGYGSTKGVKPNMVLTESQAEGLLIQDVSVFEHAVANLVKVDINQNMFDALVCFSFNVGHGALAKSTLLKKLNAGDFAGAANEFLRWNKAGGKVVNGLTRRRQAERDLFLS